MHTFKTPQAWLFPVFPWAAFAFAGLAMGFFLFDDWAMKNQAKVVACLGALGITLYYFSMWLDARPVQLFAVYDYWHTSPNFFLARVGILLVLFPLSYAWCRWVVARIAFSPLVQMGQTSLLVYWVHIEFVYGRFSILQKGAQSIAMATFGLLIITTAMVLLSVARTRWKGNGAEVNWLVATDAAARFGSLRFLRGAARPGIWVGLENQFTGVRQAKIFAGNTFHGERVGLQILHVVLQFLIFGVQLINFGLNFSSFGLRPAHCQYSVRAENVLQEQQDEPSDQEQIQISVEERAQLLSEGLARSGSILIFRGRVFDAPLHWVIHARASRANFCAAASFAASV